MYSRRELLAWGLSAAGNLLGQGVATRSVAPTPRGKPSGIPFRANFTDIAESAGLTSPVIYGGVDRKTYIVETVGCGIAFFDYDHDGWLDIFVPSGARWNEKPPAATNRLYRNNRNGTFTDVTQKAGLVRGGWASGICIGDYNNDGFDDLFLTYWGQNVLYRNNGDGTFTDVTQQAGLAGSPDQWGSGCSFIETRRDGRLDLVVATYLEFDPRKVPKPGENGNCNWKGVAVNCGPRGLPPGRLTYYRNQGNGTFADMTAASGLANARGSYCMTVVTADLMGNGWQDIFVACDSTPSFLLRNKGDGTFEEIGLESGVALSEDGMEQAGMGVGVGDFNLDGRLDIFKTHFSDDTTVLYRNEGKARFEDVTARAGLGVETRYTGWGAGVFDLDNDGLPDILFVTGSVYPELERKLPAYPYRSPRVVFRNLGEGRYEELINGAGTGVAAAHSSRGCAFGDFDNDGDIDAVIMNMNEPPSLLRNDVTGNGKWLKVKLIGVKSNRSAIGARVIARYGGKTQAACVMSQSSFYSVNDLRLHFGLGTATAADLEVHWPSGGVEQIPNVAANQFVTLREGKGQISLHP